ncbi:AtpZ/AtpI family protein [Cognatazoarcus halotolerans]|uniref:AtpZ/AtpI family protein n=1 Tax=Cognatazoarcus halotolerans TaxID=2686016 RepID=UPI001358C3EC|nr:AtpZ/AtpI family protein [Cognatazoarcus halotolerans]MBX3681007.1 AtpZ/AtpI family protein [Rhodocyclaceae bacterium]MCB1898704.1 AtpZ/AtpI family protein [Rhodocyclaceae bacterium]MCP5310875.1 AtpZ/AtpI family protein [Zoogloeaceae bacterium]
MSTAPEKRPAGEQREALSDAVRKDVTRIEKGERERRSMLGYTVFMGTIAGLFVLPVVGGAYLGRWLDSMASGYSVRWTVSLILLGVLIGAVNVYRYLEDHQ